MNHASPDPRDVIAGLLSDDRLLRACGERDMGAVFRMLDNRGVSTRRIAAAADITQGRLYDYMNGKSRVEKMALFEQIADAFHIPGHLLGLARRSWEPPPVEVSHPRADHPPPDGDDLEAMEHFRNTDRQTGGGRLYGAVVRHLSDRVAPRLVDLESGPHAFAAALDDLMTVAGGALVPGWRDTIVADLGGVGFVFLVQHEGKLQQVGLYLAPASQVTTVRRKVTGKVLLERPPTEITTSETEQARAHVAELLERPRSCTELLIEHLVLAVLLHKRIQRGQRFVAYAEWNMLHTATKDLIKTALAPASRFWGWYQLREEIALTPIGRVCLADLDAAITSPAVPDAVDVGAVDVEAALDRVLTLTVLLLESSARRLLPEDHRRVDAERGGDLEERRERQRNPARNELSLRSYGLMVGHSLP